MRTAVVIAAVVLQILVLGWMAGQREWIVATGPRIWLRTQPIDPRDIFRGDYVTLAYDISTILPDQMSPDLKTALDEFKNEGRPYRYNREMVVYAQLEASSDSEVAEVRLVDIAPPASGPFIMGRIRPYQILNQDQLTEVSYGIDAFFVEQGKGRELERAAPEGTPDNVQVPLEMQVALGRDGTAVLTGHRWNPLGVSLEIQKDTSVSDEDAVETMEPAASTKVILGFHNASPTPLAMVLPSDLRTLRLNAMEFWNSPGEDVSPPATDFLPLDDNDVRVLQPGETVILDIDLHDPRWMVYHPEKKPRPLWHREQSARSFRLVYQAPPPEACTGLKNASLIWRGRLPSRQFGPYELGQP